MRSLLLTLKSFLFCLTPHFLPKLCTLTLSLSATTSRRTFGGVPFQTPEVGTHLSVFVRFWLRLVDLRNLVPREAFVGAGPRQVRHTLKNSGQKVKEVVTAISVQFESALWHE